MGRRSKTGSDFSGKPEYKSRTQKKKEDKALQRLGEQLVGLALNQLDAMALPDEIREAVEQARTIKSHGARRRQVKHIGALLRHIDPKPIEAVLKQIRLGTFKPS